MTNYQSITGKTILTGDRPTGALHIGYYLGYCRKVLVTWVLFVVALLLMLDDGRRRL
jgi:hypothetical protein